MRRTEQTRTSVHERVVASALRAPDKPAVICDDQTLSYGNFVRNIEALAAVLMEQGFAPGDRAAILARDKALFLIAAYAVGKAGGIAVPIPDREAPRAIEQMVGESSPAFLVTTAEDLLNYPGLRQRVPCPLLLLEGNAVTADYARSVVLRGGGGESGTRPAAPDGAALLLFTVGTGGERKGALLSQRNLMQVSRNIIEFTGIDAGTCEFVMVPLYRSFGFSRCRSIFFVGGTLLMTNGALNPVTIVQSVLRHHGNALSMIPSVFSNLFGHQEATVRRVGAQIRHIELGSSPMLTEQKEHLLELFPNARICMHYGLTEAPRSTFLEFRTEREKLHTIGRPAPHVELAVAGTDGKRLAAGRTGEIIVAGAHVMLGYWQNEALTAASMTPDGWFRTGDYGFLDTEGYMTIVGRKDELITMDGMKFSLLEIEERIREFFPTYEFCVVGIPDPAGVLGEIPVLCYVAQNGKTITPSELSRLLADKIDRHKIPRIVYRVDASGAPDGKLQRDSVRAQFLETFSQPALQPK